MRTRVLRKYITIILKYLNELASFVSIFVVIIDLMFYFDYPTRFTNNIAGLILCNAIILIVFLVDRFWSKVINNKTKRSHKNVSDLE